MFLVGHFEKIKVLQLTAKHLSLENDAVLIDARKELPGS
jgi:hypothetical protein